MPLTLIMAASLMAQSPGNQMPAPPSPSRAAALYAAADLHADCIATVSGDPVSRQLCHSALRDQLERLFPEGADSAADGCLVIPALPVSRILAVATVTIAETKTVPAGSAADFAAATLLTLYPCGLRRR